MPALKKLLPPFLTSSLTPFSCSKVRERQCKNKSDLEKALELEPDNGEVKALLARVSSLQSYYDKKESKFFSNMIERLGSSETYKLLKKNPENRFQLREPAVQKASGMKTIYVFCLETLALMLLSTFGSLVGPVLEL